MHRIFKISVQEIILNKHASFPNRILDPNNWLPYEIHLNFVLIRLSCGIILINHSKFPISKAVFKSIVKSHQVCQSLVLILSIQFITLGLEFEFGFGLVGLRCGFQISGIESLANKIDSTKLIWRSIEMYASHNIEYASRKRDSPLYQIKIAQTRKKSMLKNGIEFTCIFENNK